MKIRLEDSLPLRPRLELYTLGGLRILFDGQPLSGLTSRPARALLVYLAHQNRTISRLTLAELLWPERPQASALANLRVTLHRMTALLGHVLQLQREDVRLAEGATWLDIAEMEHRLDERQPTAALELFQGEFLEGFYLEASRAYEEWQAAERERLHSEALSALQQLILQASASGEIDQAIAYSHRLLGLEPLHEPAFRQLMRLLAENGQRSAALKQFSRFRALLDKDLGIEPDAATQDLATQIESGLVQPLWTPFSANANSLLSGSIPRSDRLFPALPLPSTPLVGRQGELKEMAQMLANPDCRLLTLLGPGGIGKTRLALELAHELNDLFSDGACFVFLAEVSQSQQILPTIMDGLGFTPLPGGSPEEQFQQYLKRKNLLLVLDNFEQLLEMRESRPRKKGEISSANFLSSLLKNTLHLKILVTSRERLRIQGEWIYTLRGLSLVSPAVELFTKSAKRLRPDFRLEDNHAAVEEICRLLGGSPLAIELAAAWTPLLSAQRIAENIQANLDFLVNRLADAPDRHRSIRALFEQSWQSMEAEERITFTWMGVFAGGVRSEEILAVCRSDPALLLRLVDKSLIQEVSPGRFALHELLRQYALDVLHKVDEPFGEAAARRRHFEVYLALAEQANGCLRRSGQEAWLARLDNERENLQAALEWASINVSPDFVARLAVALGWYWRIRSRVTEARRWFEKIARLESLSLPLKAQVLFFLAGCQWMQGEFEYARLNNLQACDLWEKMGHAGESGWSYSLTMLGMSYYQLGQFVKARENFITSQAAFTSLGDEWGRGFSLGWLGRTYAALGKADLAQSASQECLGIFRRIGDHFGLALFLSNEAWRLFNSGDLDEAQELAEEASQLRRAIGHQHSLGEALSLQAAIVEKRGDRLAAVEFYRQAQAIYDSLGNQNYVDNLEQVIEELETPVS
jgi:predicted ATPase/DNA-binding SARP family transcriptional activator